MLWWKNSSFLYLSFFVWRILNCCVRHLFLSNPFSSFRWYIVWKEGDGLIYKRGIHFLFLLALFIDQTSDSCCVFLYRSWKCLMHATSLHVRGLFIFFVSFSMEVILQKGRRYICLGIYINILLSNGKHSRRDAWFYSVVSCAFEMATLHGR